MDFGGVTSGFQTPMNTIGIGNPVPFGAGICGSGDLFGTPIKQGKKGKKSKSKFAVKKPAENNWTGIEQRPLIVMSK